MAMAVIGNVSPVFLPGRLASGSRPRLLLLRFTAPGILKRRCLVASSSAFAKEVKVVDENDWRGKIDLLGCAVCYEPLTLVSDVAFSMDSVGGARLQCNCCKKSYSGKETHLELTA